MLHGALAPSGEKVLYPRLILACAALLNLVAAYGLVIQGSVDGGLKTGDYLALGLCAAVTLAVLAALWASERVAQWLAALRTRSRMIMVAAAVTSEVTIWFSAYNVGVKQFVSVNALVMILLLIATLPERARRGRRIEIVAILLALAFLLPLLLTVLVRMPFSPDEAHWADFASTAFASQSPGLYARTWLMEPVPIAPGTGWSVGAYGWFLEHVAFDFRVGRVWIFAANLAAIATIGVLSLRLYGRVAALGSVTFAILSAAFIQVFDYRPDHQIPAAVAIVFALVVAARQSKNVYRARSLDVLAGFLAVTAMQLHAVAIALVAGIGLYYIVKSVQGLLKHIQPTVLVAAPLIYYATGAILGAMLYYITNIAPVGGLEAYLAGLEGRANRLYAFHPMFSWPSLMELALISLGFVLLVIRRNQRDRLFLGLLICYLIALLVFDTQGYRSGVSALYVIPVGALIAAGFGHSGGRRAGWAVLSVTLLLAGQALGFMDRQGLTGLVEMGVLPDYVYHQMKTPVESRLGTEDTVASTHLLIWTLGNRPSLYSVASEWSAAQRWRIGLNEVWERVRPTVIIDIPGQMTIDPGLQEYMSHHDFRVCESVVIQELRLDFYRADCMGQG